MLHNGEYAELGKYKHRLVYLKRPHVFGIGSYRDPAWRYVGYSALNKEMKLFTFLSYQYYWL